MDGWFEGEVDDGDVQGHIELVNTSDRRCRLVGQPAVVLEHEGEPVRLGSGGEVNEDAAGRFVTMPPGGIAVLRVDWSPPFCDPVPDLQTITVTLPGDAGQLSVDVDEPATPDCLRGEMNEALRSHLFVSSFDHDRLVGLPPPPPYETLTATLEVPPDTVSGTQLNYRVHLRNDGDRPVRLHEHCPVYAQKVLISGTNGAQGHTHRQLYWLNCTAVPEIEPGQTVTYEMHIELPQKPPGPEGMLSWRIVHPGLPDNDHQRDATRFAMDH